ncbi:MAG: hypothetical protein Q9219_005792 [cf. Caloplaca sp. 3 TL-2023]
MPTFDELGVNLSRQLQILQPMIPTYLHLLVSALLPIYAGAHASLTRPTSAAKPLKLQSKAEKGEVDGDEVEEATSKIEGLSASDAIWFPVLAGCTLGGLYLLIKWLEDPSILSTILNGYFAIFGVLGVARLFKNTSDVAFSFIFPIRYLDGGQIWKFDDLKKLAKSESTQVRRSPLPGSLARFPLPSFLSHLLWTLRRSYPTLCVRLFIRPSAKTHAHVTPTTILSFLAALSLVLYYNLVSRPWYLTNVLGFAFAYNALQLISPTTSSTGTLILASLFVYDIYFVFYTPLMVTVATSLDIPAKLLFPRPPGPDGDPAKQHLSMLGLGDIVLPGMMIGFALRLDLFFHYLKQQKSKVLPLESDGDSPIDDGHKGSEATNKELTGSETTGKTTSDSNSSEAERCEATSSSSTSSPSTPSKTILKAPYLPATGSWGTRFWTSKSLFSSPDVSARGTQFPKPYFHASLLGYIVGMLLTLGIMQVTAHAQPALLYLVPCVLVCFWITAVVRGELRQVWKYNESEDEDEGIKAKELEKSGKEKVEKGEGEGEGKEKQGQSEGSSLGTTTVDFLSLDLQVGITESKGTKGCRRRGQRENT